MDYTVLAKNAVDALTDIVEQGAYDCTDISVSMLKTQVYDLDVYKSGHNMGLPAHRLEYHSERRSPAAADTIHALVLSGRIVLIQFSPCSRKESRNDP